MLKLKPRALSTLVAGESDYKLGSYFCADLGRRTVGDIGRRTICHSFILLVLIWLIADLKRNFSAPV